MAHGLVCAVFGFRADLAAAIFTSSFWMKWGLTLATAAAAFLLCVHLVRPESKPAWWLVALLVPVFAVTLLACVQLLSIPAGERRMVWLGHSAAQCFWCISVLAVRMLFGVLWAFRQFAPTRLRLAGLSAGLLAGAAAAVVYALHWYSAGMLVPALLGLLIGPRFLRW